MAALDTWQRWANGATITVEQLHDTVQSLADTTGTDRREHHRALGQAIRTWAESAGLDLHIAGRRRPTLEHTGPVVEL